MENHGSVGCTYRLKADVEYGETEFTRYSPGYALWPGDSQLAELKFLPLDYNGTVETNVSLNYCGQSKHVEYFEFNFTESKTVDSRVEARTLEANNTNAVIEMPVGNATLIPQEYYPRWRVGSTEVRNGKAFLEYDAPIFRRTDNITYTVLDEEGDVIGETEVSMVEPGPTLRERVMALMPQLLGGLLAVSLLGNLYLGRRRVVPERIRVVLAEAWQRVRTELEEFGDRDIKQ
jgi:hypothetical protein